MSAYGRMCRRALATLAALAATTTIAAEYPSGPIRLINETTPGGALDIAARQIAKRLGAALGQPITVEARPAASRISALAALKASAPDGHTLSMVHIAQMSAAPLLLPHLPYDPQTDFSPVGIVFREPQLLVVHPDVDATNLAGLLELSKKATSGTLRYATPAIGSPSHILMEKLKAATGADFTHIPYRGLSASIAVFKGEVELLMEGSGPLGVHLHAGKLRALAVTGSRRLSAFPDVPTFEELGIRGMDDAWVGIVAPARTPRPVIERLNIELERVMREPEMLTSYEALGRIVVVSSPEQMRAAIREELPRWTRVIRDARVIAN
jgi:tripartite-type tricarboxylate transporter receptor subunit TctC